MHLLYALQLAVLLCGREAVGKTDHCKIMDHVHRSTTSPCDDDAFSAGMLCHGNNHGSVCGIYPDENQMEDMLLCNRPSAKDLEPQNGKLYGSSQKTEHEVAISGEKIKEEFRYSSTEANDKLTRSYINYNLGLYQSFQKDRFSRKFSPETLKYINMLIPRSRFEKSQMMVAQAGYVTDAKQLASKGKGFMKSMESAVEGLQGLKPNFRKNILTAFVDCGKENDEKQIKPAEQDFPQTVTLFNRSAHSFDLVRDKSGEPGYIQLHYFSFACGKEFDGSQRHARYSMAAVSRKITVADLNKSKKFLKLYRGLDKLTTFYKHGYKEGCFLFMCDDLDRYTPEGLIRELQLKLKTGDLSQDEETRLQEWVKDYALAMIGSSYISIMAEPVQKPLREFRAAMKEEIPALISIE